MPALLIRDLSTTTAIGLADYLEVMREEQSKSQKISFLDFALSLPTPATGGTDATSLGFVSGTSLGTEAATNRAVWAALIVDGPSLRIDFGRGTWDMRFASGLPTMGARDISIVGAGIRQTTFLTGTSNFFVLGEGSVDVQGVYFDGGDAPLNAGHLFNFDALASDIDTVSVKNCRFRNIYRILSSSTAAIDPAYRVGLIEFSENRVDGRTGTGRLMVHRALVHRFDSNYIDGGPDGGTPSQHGGIICGYVENNGTGVSSFATGRVYITNNIIRRFRPSSDPGSAGVYGIQTYAYHAYIVGNTVEKIYPLTGTLTNDIVVTGDGSTTTFNFTLSALPVMDTFKLKDDVPILGVVSTVGTGNDLGWIDGDASWDNTEREAAKARQVIRSYSSVSASAWSGWVDLNTGEGSITFAVAPLAGVTFTAQYLTGVPTFHNCEPIYTKSSHAILAFNRVLDCSNNQGALCIKGNGSLAYAHSSNVGNPVIYGDQGSQLGGLIFGNTVYNRCRVTSFTLSNAFWVQQDRSQITNNYVEGMVNRIAHINTIGPAIQVDFLNNTVKDFYGQKMFFLSNLLNPTAALENVRISGLNIDGLWYDNANPLSNPVIAMINEAGDRILKNIRVQGVTITERITAGKTAIVAQVGCTTGSSDVVVKDIKSQAPWTGVVKTGTGTAGRIRLMDYCTEFMVDDVALAAGAVAITNTTMALDYA